jgi:hypothetical protein
LCAEIAREPDARGAHCRERSPSITLPPLQGLSPSSP